MRPRARFARVIMSSTAQVAREVETAIAGMNSNEPSDAVDRVGGDDRFSPEVSETLVLDCSFPLLLLNQFLKNQYGVDDRAGKCRLDVRRNLSLQIR